MLKFEQRSGGPRIELKRVEEVVAVVVAAVVVDLRDMGAVRV